MKTYRAIRAILKITGGGGDADDEKSAFKEKMAHAKEAGEEVGSLTYEKMKSEWIRDGISSLQIGMSAILLLCPKLTHYSQP